jgi:hypothetical protein
VVRALHVLLQLRVHLLLVPHESLDVLGPQQNLSLTIFSISS